MPSVKNTILDTLLSEHAVTCHIRPVIVAPEELVHVVGTQEPVRDQPDDRAHMLLTAGWLKVEYVKIDLTEVERANRVLALQQAARTWLKQETAGVDQTEREQARWMVEKTRSRESKQQIVQRVWLALVLYSLGQRGLRFAPDGQIHWEGGYTGRIGLSPNAAVDLAWPQHEHKIYVASFRQPDGTITRGKGRHRWNTYCLTIDPATKPLFERRAQQLTEKVALIVASETHATQPQLPRDFYGGDAFQQACIDAQDQPFDHILVLSPQHGVISLDDTVPSEQPWETVLERRIWAWQIQAVQRLGMYLFGATNIAAFQGQDVNWWAWINPESHYELTVFGGGFAVRILIDHLLQSRSRNPHQWPVLSFAEWRNGYNAGDFDDDFGFEVETDEDFVDDFDFEAALQDIDQLLERATEFVELVNIFVPPTGEVWELAPDEALIPVRLLTEMNMDPENLLDLLTDITLLLEQPIPLSMLINAGMVVSVLLQITHSLVHDERDPIGEILNVFPEGILRQYIETTLQEANREDQLCACLTLAEQMQLFALSVSPEINAQLSIWLQTYISSRMRQRLLGNRDEQTQTR